MGPPQQLAGERQPGGARGGVAADVGAQRRARERRAQRRRGRARQQRGARERPAYRAAHPVLQVLRQTKPIRSDTIEFILQPVHYPESC